MKSVVKKLTLSGTALALAACASGDKAHPVADTQTLPAAQQDDGIIKAGRPAMWRVADKDSDIYLFGTFHVLPPNIEWTSAAYEAAMKASETTITEADTTSAEATDAIRSAVGQYGLNPPDVTLTSLLGENRAAKFTALADELGAPMAALEPMRPWLALISLTQIVFQKSGFDPTEGVEAAVLEQAAREGDKLAYLETAASQIKALASLDGDDMLANFDTTIDQFSEFDQITARLLDAWRTGDIEGIEEDILVPLREASPGAYDALFTKRNTAWTALIEEIIAGEGDYFIAVGAGHLVGDESVINMLRAKGLAVERVQ